MIKEKIATMIIKSFSIFTLFSFSDLFAMPQIVKYGRSTMQKGRKNIILLIVIVERHLTISTQCCFYCEKIKKNMTFKCIEVNIARF